MEAQFLATHSPWHIIRGLDDGVARYTRKDAGLSTDISLILAQLARMLWKLPEMWDANRLVDGGSQEAPDMPVLP